MSLARMVICPCSTISGKGGEGGCDCCGQAVLWSWGRVTFPSTSGAHIWKIGILLARQKVKPPVGLLGRRSSESPRGGDRWWKTGPCGQTGEAQDNRRRLGCGRGREGAEVGAAGRDRRTTLGITEKPKSRPHPSKNLRLEPGEVFESFILSQWRHRWLTLRG